MSPQLLQALWNLLTPERQQKIEAILNQRTRFLTLAVEDIFDPHNTSAVLRSCEAFGVQDVHVIENHNRFELKEGVAQGTGKWLDIKRYRQPSKNNTLECFAHLKKQGYQILAATPHQFDVELPDIVLSQKTAVVFGSEKDGLSEEALRSADQRFKIPMHGFVESFNISVSCALTLYALTQKLRQNEKESIVHWQLSEEEKQILKIEWAKKSLPNGELIAKKFEDLYLNESK